MDDTSQKSYRQSALDDMPDGWIGLCVRLLDILRRTGWTSVGCGSPLHRAAEWIDDNYLPLDITIYEGGARIQHAGRGFFE